MLVLFITSVIAVPVSQSSDWLGARPSYNIDEEITVGTHVVVIKNIDVDNQGDFVEVKVDGIYQILHVGDTFTINGLELFVESISNFKDTEDDTTTIFFVHRGKTQSKVSKQGYSSYDLNLNSYFQRRTGEKIQLEQVMASSAIIKIDDKEVFLNLNEKKQVGNLELFLSEIRFNHRSPDTSSIVLDVMYIKQEPKLVLEPYTEEPIHETPSEPETTIVEEMPERTFSQVIFEFIKKIFFIEY